eukprot:CAMPEP_0174244124 /NCGR_PEP_ID=MMETSP0417-20130205/34126_1 /TAXON_ID=242541 /ORGANISM="Mayorella sp, Strain BSH-02190019" /LENGTH=226 /DNA_ID=CAMNT_0015323751 /DNA_START=68 /DNA_END=744 /DNA_ORIENTATION=+
MSAERQHYQPAQQSDYIEDGRWTQQDPRIFSATSSAAVSPRHRPTTSSSSCWTEISSPPPLYGHTAVSISVPLVNASSAASLPPQPSLLTSAYHPSHHAQSAAPVSAHSEQLLIFGGADNLGHFSAALYHLDLGSLRLRMHTRTLPSSRGATSSSSSSSHASSVANTLSLSALLPSERRPISHHEARISARTLRPYSALNESTDLGESAASTSLSSSSPSSPSSPS